MSGIPIWGQPPHAGSTYRRRKPKPQQTRHVIDRTLGGDVVFVEGRSTRLSRPRTHSLAHWREWVKDAVKLSG